MRFSKVNIFKQNYNFSLFLVFIGNENNSDLGNLFFLYAFIYLFVRGTERARDTAEGEAGFL